MGEEAKRWRLKFPPFSWSGTYPAEPAQVVFPSSANQTKPTLVPCSEREAALGAGRVCRAPVHPLPTNRKGTLHPSFFFFFLFLCCRRDDHHARSGQADRPTLPLSLSTTHCPLSTARCPVLCAGPKKVSILPGLFLLAQPSTLTSSQLKKNRPRVELRARLLFFLLFLFFGVRLSISFGSDREPFHSDKAELTFAGECDLENGAR